MGEHSGIIHKVSRLYCSTEPDREDLAQEILIQLRRCFSRYDGRVLFLTWMYRVALNTAISFLREQSRRTQRILLGEPVLMELATAPEEESAEVKTVRGLIAQLPPLDRALMLLHLEGHNYGEIAQTGCRGRDPQKTMNLDRLKFTTTPLDRLRITLGFEGLSAAIALILLGNFMFRHLSEPRFLWPAIFMHVWTVAVFAATVRQLIILAAIHYDDPVVQIQ